MKKFLAIILALVMLLSMAACAKAPAADAPAKDTPATEGENGSGEQITIEMWLQGDNVGDPSLPEDEWWITNAIAEYEAAHPNIKIEMSIPSGQSEITQTYKAAYVAGTEPDIVNLWSGTNLFSIADLLVDHKQYVSADDLQHITTFNECYMAFDDSQALLGIPNVEAGKNICTFYYNKTIFNEVGIDLEANPIETADDFEAVLKKLQDAGYQPISCDDEGYGVMFCCFGLAWANAVGSDGMYNDSVGVTKFADDTTLIRVMELANDWYNKGYINQDYVTCTESLSNFLQGKAAIFGAGTWYMQDIAETLGAENVGVLGMCHLNDDDPYDYDSLGGNGQVFCISNHSEHPQEAADFISFLNSKEQVEKAQAQHLVLPGRDDVAYPVSGGLYDEVLETFGNSLFYYDNTLRADVVTEFYRVWPLVVSGYTTVDEAIASLDAVAASGEAY